MIMRFKLNNKGNTLAIVLIGIFILSILGTLVLGITSTNYNMKLVEQKTEKTLYYAEKGADKLYTVIGAEVMKCATDSYKEVLEGNLHEDATGSKYVIKSKDENEKEFRKYYLEGKMNGTSEEFKGIKDLYPEDKDTFTGDEIDIILTRLNNDCDFNYDGYNVTIKPKTNSEIEYVNVTGTSDLEKIILHNICVECESINTGYYSSITTDYTISVPNIVIDLSSSPTGGFDLGDLGTFALIAEGNSTSKALEVTGTSKAATEVSVNGNVYTGNNVSVDKTKFGLNADVFFCKEDFVVNDSKVIMMGSSAVPSENSNDTLQFYVKNIKTEDNNTLTGNAELDITGNCIVEDDLEVNGTNSTIKLSGNYFGHGYRASSYDVPESNTTQMSSFYLKENETTYLKEHMQSSAIIINGKGTSFDATGLKELVLAGRAYIDLDFTGTDASYMTGESVSVRGNQSMYLASSSDLAGSIVQGKNPISYDEFKGLLRDKDVDIETTTPSLSDLGLSDTANIIAKEIKDASDNKYIYFYVKQSNPGKQTEYYIDKLDGADKYTNREILNSKISATELDIKKIEFSPELKYHTVGAITEISDNSLSGYKVKSGVNGVTSANGFVEFKDLLEDIDTRIDIFLPELRNINKEGRILGKDTCGEMAVYYDDDSPFNYYIIDPDGDDGIDKKETDWVTNRSIPDDEISDLIASYDSSKTVGYLINIEDTDTTTVTVGTEFSYGVVVTDKPVVVQDDFEGLIMTSSSITINNGCEIKANKALVDHMFENISELGSIIKINNGSTGASEDKEVVTADSIKYTDLVKKSNWRKNAD